MARPRKQFVQLWERQRRNGARLPAAFYFIRGNAHRPDAHNEWRCFYGPVGKVRRSRVFIDHSAIYGFIGAKELLYSRDSQGVKAAKQGNSRFIRSRILDRIRKPALVPETQPVVYETPVAATEMIAAEASGGETISLL